MDHVISEFYYKENILQRNYYCAKFHYKKILGATTWLCYIQTLDIMRCFIKGQYCIYKTTQTQIKGVSRLQFCLLQASKNMLLRQNKCTLHGTTVKSVPITYDIWELVPHTRSTFFRKQVSLIPNSARNYLEANQPTNLSQNQHCPVKCIPAIMSNRDTVKPV